MSTTACLARTETGPDCAKRSPRAAAAHHLNLAVVLAKPHHRDVVVGGEAVHRRAERRPIFSMITGDLRMLSYYLSWHMKQRLAPILFQDNDKPTAAAKRANPAAAKRSDAALAKAARKRTQDGTPVHSFTSLLDDLATICANQIQPTDDMPAFTTITTPTPLQRQAFELLGVSHRHGLV